MGNRSLAVEIVDAIHGYTYEYSNQPSCHLQEYDQVEDILDRHLDSGKRWTTVVPGLESTYPPPGVDVIVGKEFYRGIPGLEGSNQVDQFLRFSEFTKSFRWRLK